MHTDNRIHKRRTFVILLAALLLFLSDISVLQVRNVYAASPGKIVKASNGVIENNVVERSHYDAISIYPEYEWLEGGCSRNVTIRGNVIRKCGGGISVGGKSGNGTRLPKEAHAGVVIGENDIK